MKFLFITTKPLIPNSGGYTIRLYNILKRLHSRGHVITLISFADSKEQDILNKNNDELKSICDKFIPISINRKWAYLQSLKAIFSQKPFKAEYYNFKKARNIIENEIQNDDYDYVSGYLYLTYQFIELCKNKKTWIDLVDAVSMFYIRQIKNCHNIFKKIFLMTEQKRVLNLEKKIIENSSQVTIISDIDKQYLSDYINTDKIKVLKNGVDVNDIVADKYNPNQIAYLGDMEYIQNHDAVIWFIDNVLPKLVQKNPDIMFKIIGKNPKSQLYEHTKNSKNIIITGEVEDVKKELSDSAVLVCPIRISAGLQNKILEAMSIGLPSIVTTQVAIPIVNNQDILLQANTVSEWENQIFNVLNDADYRNNLSRISKDFVKNNFNWNIYIDELVENIK